jgi:hypothetical protein
MAESSWIYSPSDGADLRKSATDSSAKRPVNVSAFSGSNAPSDKHAPSRIRRRNRVITSCLECRRRKLKCDKQAPCTNCTRFKRDCLYLAPALDPTSQQKLAEIKERMGALEKNLEREVAAQTNKAHIGGANITKKVPAESFTHVEPDDEDDLAGGEDEEGLEPTPLAALDNVYEDGGEDELVDLGVQMGKMRISERIGGWIRPKLVDELNDTLKDVTGGKSRWSTAPTSVDHRELNPSTAPQPRIQASPKSYIGPGPDYIAPASSFFFPGTNMSTGLIDYLPSKNASDQLIQQYFLAVHYMCRTVHRPTFEAQYTLFWGQIATGTEPAPAVQAIIFAAMFSGAVSFGETEITQRFGRTRAALVDSLRSGTEFALAKANFLRTTRSDVMQAFVMYLIPLVRAEVSRAHSALVGTAIRLAECMGLHRDGSHYSMTPVEVNVRRLIWHQLCFLDMRTCEATGPRPQIRPGDYDTKLPLNVDDADLLSENPPTEDKPYWTDMTLIRIRAECVELRRQLWFDIVQIDRKKKSLTSTVVKIQKTWNHMTAKYFSIIDESVPLQRLAKHIMTLGVQGCFIQVLHRYLFSTAQRMPDRLRQILIEAGLTQMENAISLETDAELAPWAWYKGAFNQYHSALLLMVEVYAYPMRKDAAKIWKCLDYIFDIPPHLSPKQKAELVITDLRDRMEVYHQMRKLKVTSQMEERVGALHNKSGIVVDRPQDDASGGAARGDRGSVPLPPVNFSPPPLPPSESGSGGGSASRSASVAGGTSGGAFASGNDVTMMMDDIDWVGRCIHIAVSSWNHANSVQAEWDQYFPIEQNTGDLNIPDFDFNNFTGGFNSGSSLDPATFATVASSASAGVGGQSADMSDVSFTPTFIPGVNYQQIAESRARAQQSYQAGQR